MYEKKYHLTLRKTKKIGRLKTFFWFFSSQRSNYYWIWRSDWQIFLTRQSISSLWDAPYEKGSTHQNNSLLAQDIENLDEANEAVERATKDLQTRIELTLSCQHLPKLDFLSQTDAKIVCYLEDGYRYLYKIHPENIFLEEISWDMTVQKSFRIAQILPLKRNSLSLIISKNPKL